MDDRDRMSHRTAWVPWAITSVVLVLVALFAYTIGAGRQAVVDGEPVRHVWVHGGFGGFWLFILLFWFAFGGLRRMWWGCGYPYYPGRYRRYYRHPYDYDDEREDWDEWHRRAHSRMNTPAGGGGSSTSTPNPGG